MPTDLPFVGRTTAKEQISYWTVSPSGTFDQGTRNGQDMATAYIAYLSNNEPPAPMLPQVVIDMLAATELPPALQGQIVGFFSLLEDALAERTLDRGLI